MVSGRKISFPWVIVMMSVILVVVCILDLAFGGTHLNLGSFFSALVGSSDQVASTILWKIRFPRMLLAVICGASLSLGGVLMQSIFRNPLSDPHIMGVSAGAGLGAAIATTLLGTSALSLFGGVSIMTAAFLGAVLSSVLVLAVSSSVKSASTLLVFGVILGFVLSALTSIIEYFSSEQSLKIFYNWSAGSFSSAQMSQIGAVAIFLAIGLILSVVIVKGLDIILFGEQYATLSGANVSGIRIIALLACCIITGSVTALCGPIGFVGIVSAHVARRLLGSSLHGKVIPVAMLSGAVLCTLADLLSQVSGTPLPVGSVMAIIGSPIVLYILLSKRI